MAILPNKQAAQILSSGLLSVWNLFSGYVTHESVRVVHPGAAQRPPAVVAPLSHHSPRLLPVSNRFFVPKPALSAGSSWLWYCSPMSYSFNAMGSVQFHCEGASCPHIATVSSQGVGTAQVSDYMDQ